MEKELERLLDAYDWSTEGSGRRSLIAGAIAKLLAEMGDTVRAERWARHAGRV